MSDIAVWTKILQVREREQEDAQRAQINARDKFEKVATKLYDSLKEKETAELSLQKSMETHLIIEKIKEQSLYIQSLTNKILKLQEQVQIARNEMNEKQVLLNESYMEVKKIEKLIENRQKAQYELEKKDEAAFMDEISVRQYYVQTQK